jgi:hypothetical protein
MERLTAEPVMGAPLWQETFQRRNARRARALAENTRRARALAETARLASASAETARRAGDCRQEAPATDVPESLRAPAHHPVTGVGRAAGVDSRVAPEAPLAWGMGPDPVGP